VLSNIRRKDLQIQDSVEALVDLGLTHLQAKVYVTLVSLGNATARDIHASSNIQRSDIYHVLSELEEKDLVERLIAKPTKFKPITPNEAVSTLLERRKEQTRALRKNATQALRELQNVDNGKTQALDMGSQFILLSKSKTNPSAHIDKLGEAVTNAQTSVMCLTSFPLFMKIKYMEEQNWKRGAKKGVKFNFIINGASEKRRTNLNLDPVLNNSDNFQIRLTCNPPSACLLLVDEKQAFCRIGLDLKSPVLLSLAPIYVAMMKDFFETKWKSLSNDD
jgi:sugar-specific transcriptional regulator TrmB